MKRISLLIIILHLVFALAAILPPGLSREGNPQLYSTLMPKAEANLKSLPKKLRKNYKKLLKEYDDILMAYLIAYESDANLAAANPKDVFSNYRELRVFLDKEGLRYMPEFFLSYIAKQSVSDERISAYRKAMLDDGLRQVWEDNSDILQRYRATASWCVEKLKFQQTSGRDQSPLDITQKSLTGRCEEMQILFVAAARTVGIPSRPASTPWWAHIDNNHAWAEVFLDREWAYTGDMDAAYHPNQTWFSGLIDKTVLILADGSMPTAEDEVLAEGRYEILINSTRNYARERTRTINVQVLDSEMQAVPEALISVMVFNWGSLRTLCNLSTDQDGKVSFSAGRGAFYLSAYKDEQQVLIPVASSTDAEVAVNLQLSSAPLAPQNAIMHYPGNEMDWKKAPQDYQDDIAQRKIIWQEQLDRWQHEVQALGIAEGKLQDLLIKSRGNHPELKAFFDAVPQLDSAYIDFLAEYDPKFLWQADARQLEAAHNHFIAQNRDPEYPQELYYPTVFYEDLSQAFKYKGKWYLYPSSFIQKAKDDKAKLGKTISYLHKRFKIDPEKALQGLLPLDTALKQKYLTNYQFRILAISALRANGIAADYTRVPDNILVYLNDDWHYYDVIKKNLSEADEEQPTHSLNLYITDAEGYPLHISDEQLSLTRLVKGQFYTLNTRFEYQGNGKYQALIPDQDTYLQFGYRISDSDTAIQIIPLNTWDQSSEIRLLAKQYPKTWQEADPAILAMFDAATLAASSLILLGNHDQENSLRILDRIKDMPHRFFGYAASPSETENYQVLPAWQELVRQDSANMHRTITLHKVQDKWLYYEGRWENLPH